MDVLVETTLAARGARHPRRQREFAIVLRVLAAALRTGASMPQALARAADRCDGSVAEACGASAARMQLGAPVEEELSSLAARLDLPAAQLLAQIVAVQHRRGGDLARPCARLAVLIDQRGRLDAEARTATAQARFAGRAVIAIPGLLAGAAWWRAPEAVDRLLSPGTLLLASPGLALVVTGSIIAARVGAAAGRGDTRAHPDGSGRFRTAIGTLAGQGPRSLASARLATAASVVCLPSLVMRPSPAIVVAAMVFVAASISWPWAERSAARRRAERTAEAGIEALLEVSIALFAAGATAHDVARIAPSSVPDPLRTALAPAVHRVALGRTIVSSFGDLPVVLASPHVDAWLHAICSSAELGSASVDVLEGLLRDARAARREAIRAAAATAGPRMQLALVLLVVPGIMWIMLVATVGSLVAQLRSAGVV